MTTNVWTSFGTRDARERMIGVAMRHGAKNRADAEDCVQEALISAYTTHASLDDERRALAWLAQIVANATRMRLRANKRHRRGGDVEHVDVDEERVANVIDPERTVAELESLHRLHTMPLAKHERDFLRDCLSWEGTLNTLAATRGENVSAVKTRLRRLRMRMRAHIDDAEAA